MNKFYDVYIDSDGVLFDFDGHFYAVSGKRIQEVDRRHVWSIIGYHNQQSPFFRNLPKMADADVLVDFVSKTFERYAVLTATGHTPADVEQQKRDGFAEHYPGLTVHCVKKSPDKAAQFAAPNAILIDDRAKSIDPWIEAGGIGILHKSADETMAELIQYAFDRDGSLTEK